MFEKLKEKRKLKKKYKKEESIKKRIIFNEWRIQQYKEYPKKVEAPLREFEEDICICCCAENWDYYKKYDVDVDLFNKFELSEKVAEEEYYKMENRIRQEKVENEQREKIDLYKKAILELKGEGKI